MGGSVEVMKVLHTLSDDNLQNISCLDLAWSCSIQILGVHLIYIQIGPLWDLFQEVSKHHNNLVIVPL